MKKLFITGGCGFIGSNFIISEIKKGDRTILNYDLLTYSGNKDNLKAISKNEDYSFIEGDICNYDALFNAISNFKPDYIIHFAAESHVDRSIDDPIKFINTNIVGTATLLNVLTSYFAINSKFKFINISTDEVYGSLGSSGFFDENTNYDPSSPYSASKASSDHLVSSWHKTYGLPVITTHCSNNYGPYQFPEKLIPLVIANCIDQRALPIYGNGLNIRDWLYVQDHCNALSLIMDDGELGETYNIGGNNEIRNIDIVLNICKILDILLPRKNKAPYKELIEYVDDRPGHDFRYAIDSSKIQKNLNWKPLESFESGIYKTVKWYIKNEIWWRKIQKKHYKQERLGLKK